MTIDCAADTDFIDGKLTGFLAGGRVLLRNNGLDGLELAENGGFMFPTPLEDSSAFIVSVVEFSPANLESGCYGVDASGAMSGRNVGAVNVLCSGLLVIASLNRSMIFVLIA